MVASRRLLCRRYDNSDCRLLLLIVVGAVEDEEVVVANVSLAHVLHQSTLALSCLMSDTATSRGSGGAQQFKRHSHPQREDLSSSRSRWTTYSTSKARLRSCLTGQRHLVILVVVVGGAEKGLHRLELAGDEHQVILHLLPQLLLLFHRRLDQAQRPWPPPPSWSNQERTTTWLCCVALRCVALSIGSTLRPAQLCFVVMANNALQDCNGLCTWLDMGV